MLAPTAPAHDKPAVCFQCESFDAWYGDAGELIRREAIETGIAALLPNLDEYRARDQAKTLAIMTARVQGELVGYLLYNMFIHPHYTLPAAEPDLFYVAREYSGFRVGVGLLDIAEAFMKSCGIKLWCARVPHGATHGKFYERKGFKPIEMLYIKEL